MPPKNLLELAREKFEGELSEAEEKLFEATGRGETATVSYWDNDNSYWEGASLLIRADRIVWLMTNKQARRRVAHNGVAIRGAKIDGEIDLPFVTWHGRFCLFDCYVDDNIYINDSSFNLIILSNTCVKSIIADRLKISGSLFLRDNFKSCDGVRLVGAEIGGSLNCSGGEFCNKDGDALNADRIFVKGDVYICNGFKAKGRVSFLSAEIGGYFNCSGGKFSNDGGNALDAEGVAVRRNVLFCNGFESQGGIRLLNAEIGGDLDCSLGKIQNNNCIALHADRIKVKGGVFLHSGFKSRGEVRFLGACIGGGFCCSMGEFCNPTGYSLNADGIKVKGYVSLCKGFKSLGEVRFLSAEVGNGFDCSGGEFNNEKGDALGADGIKVSGCVFLSSGFKALGEVRFIGADISGNLDCAEGMFYNGRGSALNANIIKVQGNVLLRGIKYKGKVSLYSASIGGGLAMDNIQWQDCGDLDLRQASARTLYDDINWPNKGRLILDGFNYKFIADDSPVDAKARLEWLSRQPDNQFYPQPYEILAKVLKASGHEQAAKEVLIGKNETFRIMLWNRNPAILRRWYIREFLKTTTFEGLVDLSDRMKKTDAELAEYTRNYPTLSRSSWIWFEISRKLTCYGYQSWRILIAMLFFVMLGGGLFEYGHLKSSMTTTVSYTHVQKIEDQKLDPSVDLPGMISFDNAHLHDPALMQTLASDYPHFNAIIYSLDAFLPLIDLNQQTYWMPNMNKEWGPALRVYLVIHILMGWFLTSLLLVSFTGLIKQ